MYVVYMRHRLRPHLISFEIEEDSSYMAHRVAAARYPDYLVTRIICRDYTTIESHS